MGVIRKRHTPPLVVGYHQVVKQCRTDWRQGIRAMQTSCAMLEKHLDWIGRRHNIVSLDELGHHLKNGTRSAKPLAAITFDDGYQDVYLNAFPILIRKGIPATVFVVTDIVGTPGAPLHDRLYLVLARAIDQWAVPAVMLAELLVRLDITPSNPGLITQSVPDAFLTMRALFDTLRQSEIQRLVDSLEAEFRIEPGLLEEVQPMNWEMLAEMNRNGITIGSHTKSHALLTTESGRRIREEIDGSRQELESRLGISVKHFAYPDGRFNSRTVRAVADSGFQFAYTTCRHQFHEYPHLTIPRKLLWENSCMDSLGRFSSALMNCQVHWMFDSLNGCLQDHNGTGSNVTTFNEITGVDPVSIRDGSKS
ncbi:MAG TPA: polysaccharide deacetylase family protein [Terriglobia bacterium]|nr:polysaccharide deacetylase family protein [Terriglobia bacterium]